VLKSLGKAGRRLFLPRDGGSVFDRERTRMTNPNRMGVILAAGRGTRMLPFSDHWPKPCLPIANKPLLRYQLEALRTLGVRDVLVVIGHLGYEVVRALGDGADLGLHLRYVDQGDALGIAHAVAKLEPHVDRPFFLFLGDIFFETENLGKMNELFDGDRVSAVLAVKREPDSEKIKRNFVVLLGQDGLVHRLIEKPRHPRTDLKGCGLYLFDPAFFDAIRHTPRTAMRDEYEITDAIQIFIDDGYGVAAAEVVRDDMNLSYPPDLLAVNLHVLDTRGGGALLGEGVRLAPGAVVERSVLMDRVVVEHPIRIRDCLVFPDRVVQRRSDLERAILIPGHEIDCR